MFGFSQKSLNIYQIFALDFLFLGIIYSIKLIANVFLFGTVQWQALPPTSSDVLMAIAVTPFLEEAGRVLSVDIAGPRRTWSVALYTLCLIGMDNVLPMSQWAAAKHSATWLTRIVHAGTSVLYAVIALRVNEPAEDRFVAQLVCHCSNTLLLIVTGGLSAAIW